MQPLGAVIGNIRLAAFLWQLQSPQSLNHLRHAIIPSQPLFRFNVHDTLYRIHLHFMYASSPPTLRRHRKHCDRFSVSPHLIRFHRHCFPLPSQSIWRREFIPSMRGVNATVVTTRPAKGNEIFYRRGYTGTRTLLYLIPLCNFITTVLEIELCASSSRTSIAIKVQRLCTRRRDVW